MSEPKIFTKENRPAEIAGEFVIPEGYTKIGENAFRGCTDLTSIEIPNSITEIGGAAFYDCTGLTSIKIPDSVTKFGAEAFRNCTSLTSIEIPNSVTFIGQSAFYGCTGLTSIKIPDSVTVIDHSVFHGCASLTSIKLPTSVNSWNIADAFSDCTSLTSIEIPNGVTEIRDKAFRRCTSLASIIIPNSVKVIGYCAFEYCTGLSCIEFPDSVYQIGDCAFGDCTGLTNVELHSVSSINRLAFCGCTGLTSVVIPASVRNIHSTAFACCTGLTHIVVDENNPSYTLLDGFLLTKDKKTLVKEMCLSRGNVVIPDSVETIWDYAFYNCTGLTSIEIPNSVTYIGSCAFRDCTGLTSIEIPNSVTEIGDLAFKDCNSLTLFTHPKDLKFKKKDIFGDSDYKGIKFAKSGTKTPEKVADANTDTVRGGIQGEVVCVSGKFKDHTQEEMEALVVGNGATISTSVTKKTTILVTGDKVGATKLTKAQELGIRIIPQDEFFKMVAGDSTTSSENLTKQEVHVRFEITAYSRWNLHSISKDELEEFISEYSDEEINLDEEEGVERASEILEENMADFWDAFECWPENIHIWQEGLTLTVTGEDDELKFSEEELDGVPVKEERVKSEKGDGFTVISETTAKYPTYEADIEIEGDFDINKLSVVNHIVEYDGDSYCWQDILYNGEKIDLELTYDRVISDEISLKKD